MTSKTIRRFLASATCLLVAHAATAQSVTATWEYSDTTSLSACTLSGDDEPVSLLTASYLLGENLTVDATLTGSNADDGYTAVEYSPAFTALKPTVKVTTATSGNNLAVGLTPATGHSFKPTKVSFDACREGTDKGGIVVRVKESGGEETELGSVTPLRNKITSGNSTGYSPHEFYVNDMIGEDKAFLLVLYITDSDPN